MTALEVVVHEEWGRLLALLVARFRRLDLAEDALGDAVEAAARTWPESGVPENPAGWLMTAARRRALDRLRAEAVAARSLPLLAVQSSLVDQARQVLADGTLPGEHGAADERLRLLLLCAHPSLKPESAAALALRLVLGVPTGDIARLFLVQQSTMAARLTRARKALTHQAFTVPTGQALTDRVSSVADIAYLAFTAGYAPGTGPDVLRAAEAGEAIRLVRVLRDLGPPESAADLDALLALMILQHSRRDARVAAGELVLLAEQDRSRWRYDEIAEAVRLLTPLAAAAPSTPYLLQALIAAQHAIARSSGDTDWARIAEWYAELEALTDNPVVRLNRAVCLAQIDGPPAGLALLEGLDLPGHRVPAVRAELLGRAGLVAESRLAYDEALSRCDNDAERRHLLRRRAATA